MQTSAIGGIISFIRRYKLLHIVFWVWSYVSLLHFYNERYTDKSLLYYDVVIILLFRMWCVYFIVDLLIPKFLNKKKYFRFVCLFISAIVLFSGFNIFFQDLLTVIKNGRHISPGTLLIMFLSRITDNVIITSVFFAIYTVKDRYDTEKRTNKLEKEKLLNELNFLKAQLNPHFLFNAINSIYVLIEEDKKLASQTLLKFSGLLRYQLYDCSNDWMPIDREIEFLKDYVDLEKMRNNDNLNVSFQIECGKNNLEIAPFILTPFVENAFKHKSNYKDQNYVIIKGDVTDKMLTFSVTNTYGEFTVKSDQVSGGIGLQNVYRRLELLYPGKHRIEVVKNEETYCINLELELHENAMYFSG